MNQTPTQVFCLACSVHVYVCACGCVLSLSSLLILSRLRGFELTASRSRVTCSTTEPAKPPSGCTFLGLQEPCQNGTESLYTLHLVSPHVTAKKTTIKTRKLTLEQCCSLPCGTHLDFTSDSTSAFSIPGSHPGSQKRLAVMPPGSVSAFPYLSWP